MSDNKEDGLLEKKRKQKYYFYDLHCHSKKSYDSINDMEKIIFMAKERGLDGIAITDHDILYSGPTEIDGITIIKGVEITLKDHSHLLAFYIKENIPSKKLNLKEVVFEIKKQGGYSSLAHPCRNGEGWFSVKKRTEAEIMTAISLPDAIETGNFKNSRKQREKAKRYIYKLGKNVRQTAGSDSHSPGTIGFSVIKTTIPINSSNFLSALENSEIIIRKEVNNSKRFASYLEEFFTILAKKTCIYYNKRVRKLYHKLILRPFSRIISPIRKRKKFNYQEEYNKE